MAISLKDILKTVAPTLAGMLPGPLGDLARKEVNKALGLDETATEDEAAAVLAKADPAKFAEFKLALEKLDQDYAVRMRELELSFAQADDADRSSARAREIEMAKAGRKNATQAALAWLSVIGMYGSLLLLWFKPMPVGQMAAILVIVTSIANRSGDVYHYFFGSSRGSDRKNETIDRALASQNGK